MWPEALQYKKRKVLVTGGFGFLGLNLVKRLVHAGANVRVLTRSGPPPVFAPLTVALQAVVSYKGRVEDAEIAKAAIDGVDVIFNLAGTSGAVVSNANPDTDLDANVRAQLAFLNICVSHNRHARVVFPSSRLVYRPTAQFPVTETADLAPVSIYGIHKLAVEHYHHLYHRLHGIPTTVLRITNPYGTYQNPERTSHGFINHLIHLAINDEVITLFGDGAQLRDYVCVDDVVRALLIAGMHPAAVGMTFNVGSGSGVSLKAAAQLIVEISGSGRIRHVEWPHQAAKTETGGFVANIARIREAIDWVPTIGLAEGLAHVISQHQNSVPMDRVRSG